MVDVMVIGAGPAGLAAGASCAEAGLSVCVVDPEPAPRFPNTYGVWLDEVDLPGSCVAERWSRPLFFSDLGGRRALDRTYGHLDNDALAAWLVNRLRRAGGRLRADRATGLASGGEGTVVTLHDAGPVASRIVVDASGAARRFLAVDAPMDSAVAWQTAYGIVASVEGAPWAPGEMTLMDYRSLPGQDLAIPSFLYGMPLREGRVLLEETVLAAAPAVPTSVLEARLRRRIDALGIRVRDVHEVERVAIPMNAPLPRMPQPVVGFGVAAGFVHPATGYSIARSLRQAPMLASALARGLGPGGSPERAAALAWRAIHPPVLRRAQRLARSGLEVLLQLDPEEVVEFMTRFFELPPRHWQAYLSGTAPSRELACAMFRLGPNLSLRLLARVTTASMGRGRRDLLLGLVPGLERHVS